MNDINNELQKKYLQDRPLAIRDGFGEGLAEASRRNPKVIALCADLTASCRMDIIQKEFPDRFVEIGVAEQNLIGVGAGLARTGMIPFCGSFAAFSPGRSFDQIRVSVCYSKANVKIYGGHAGITVGEDGATHQMLEDVAMMRSLPGMTVFVPCDMWQAYQGTLALAQMHSPAYIRGSRASVLPVTTLQTPFSLGKIDIVRVPRIITSKKVVIVACGIMVGESIKASEILEQHGISATVLNCHTIKPFDVQTLLASVCDIQGVIVAEEHQVAGGLFGLVSETLAKHQPMKVLPVAVMDTFGESGMSSSLLEKYGLTSAKIQERAQELFR